MTFRVVLTGGVASGKSVVANEFAALGVPVLDTDQISRDVQAPGTPTLEKIVAVFGKDILDAHGGLERRKMRERVFADAKLRKQLNDITHPAIRDELARRSAIANGAYQIHAIPLYVDTGGKGNYDRVLVVDCSEDIQIKRLMQRDGIDPTQAKNMLAAQATRGQRLAAADDVLVNEDSLDALREQVRRLHENYLKQATSRH